METVGSSDLAQCSDDEESGALRIDLEQVDNQNGRNLLEKQNVGNPLEKENGVNQNEELYNDQVGHFFSVYLIHKKILKLALSKNVLPPGPSHKKIDTLQEK